MMQWPEKKHLCVALEEAFQSPIQRVRRVPCACSSSFVIEDLLVTVAGREIPVIFKNLDRDAVVRDAAGVKPAFLYDPLREINTYRRLHPLLNLGTARLYGAVTDPAKDRYWLFIEKVSAPELYQLGDLETWIEAARWLARFHSSEGADAASAR